MNKKQQWIGHVSTGPMAASENAEALFDRFMRVRGLLRKDGKFTRKAERILDDHLAGKCGCAECRRNQKKQFGKVKE